jgi:aldehyde:ferredoxin oxidoreductase
MYGYTGKLLFVNLTDKTWEARELSEETARDFVGGPALGAKILYDEMPAHTDAFAPESMIGFVSGPTNSTGALMGGRYTFVCKSPVYNGWNDANSGGHFGPMMRKAGFDGVFFKGISEKPVYLFVDNGKVEFRDASHLWGKTVSETEKAINEELGDPRVCIALIGPAGENLSNLAAVMNDTDRAAARGGPGAAMGSKHLKALAVRGDTKIEAADKEALLALNKQVVEYDKEGPIAGLFKVFSQYGTSSFYESSVYSGDALVKNSSGSAADLTEAQIKPLTGEVMDPKYRKKKFACNACPAGCGAIYEIKGGKETSRPEYETLGMFGSLLLNSDADSVNHCNWLCSQYGYDTVAAGGTLAWLMECYCSGLFTLEELDGIDLKWGNADAIVRMMEQMCKNEGIGKILNRGSREAARHFNRGFEYLAVASGVEIPQHDSRFNPGIARTYQYDPTPGRHVKGGLGIGYGNQPPEVKQNYEDTGSRDVAGVIEQEIINAGGFCSFHFFALPPGIHKKYLRAITGFDFEDEEILNKTGLRSFTIRHAFNLREGLRRKDWDISQRMVGKPPLKEGPNAGVTVDNEKLADNFFHALDWNVEDAVPTKEALERIGGLENVIKDLYPEG